MARKLILGFLATIAVAATIQSSAAQTTYTVGGTTGWGIPQGGATFYSAWAANQTFSVGDILVFNFANNQHDVTKVNKAGYDGCATTNAITRVTTSPARITINESGEHYFICGFPGHCAAGQKLTINVTSSTSAPAPQPSSPAPQPSAVPVPAPAPQSASPSPAPVASPAPVPVSSPESAPSPASTPSDNTYIVGDSQGWTLTSNTAQLYQNWAAGKTFLPGDILVFNYSNGAHDVTEVSKADFDSCSTASPIFVRRTPPTRITLTAGDHYYICGVPGHCTGGQKLAVTVGASTPGGAPSPFSPSPAGSTAPPTPDSSASSLGVAGVSAAFLSVIGALLF